MKNYKQKNRQKFGWMVPKMVILYNSVQFSCLVVSDSLRPRELQHARLPCPPPCPVICSSSCPLSQWCYLTFSSSAALFFCLQSFPASGSFLMSQPFTSGGQNIGASALASFFPMSVQDWFPLGLTGLILLSKGLSRVFSNSTIRKHQFFGTQKNLVDSMKRFFRWGIKAKHGRETNWRGPGL